MKTFTLKWVALCYAVLCIGYTGFSQTNLPLGRAGDVPAHSDLGKLKSQFNALLDSKGKLIHKEDARKAKKLARSIGFWENRTTTGNFQQYGANLLLAWQYEQICQTHEGYINTPATKWRQVPLLAKPSDPTSTSIYAGGTGAIMSQWIHPNNPNEIYIGGSSSGVWRTLDGGNNWQNITDNSAMPGHGVGAISVDPSNSNNILISVRQQRFGKQYNIGTFRTTNGGFSWLLVDDVYNSADPLGVLDIERIPGSPNTVIAVSHNKIYRSTNGGLNFSVIATAAGCNTYAEASNFKKIYVNPYNVNDVYVNGAEFWYSSNGGLSFANKNVNLPNGCADVQETSLDIAEDDPNKLYLLQYHDTSPSSSGGHSVMFYESTNHGDTWTSVYSSTIPGQTAGPWMANLLAIDYNTFFYGRVRIHSIDEGENGNTNVYEIGSRKSNLFNSSYYHDDIRAFNKLKVGTKWYLYAATDGGLFRSKDLGETWECLNEQVDLSEAYDFDTHSRSDEIYFGYQDMGFSAYNKKTGVWANNLVYADGVQVEGGLHDEGRFFVKTQGATGYVFKDGFKQGSSQGMYNAFGGEFDFNTGDGKDYRNPEKVFLSFMNIISYDLDNKTYNHITNYTEATGLHDSLKKECMTIANANSNPDVIYTGWRMAGGWYSASMHPNLLKGNKNPDGSYSWTDISVHRPSSNLAGESAWQFPNSVAVNSQDENIVMVGMNSGDQLEWGAQEAAYLSLDGGVTWENKSYGLPEKFGVNDMIYQHGTDNRFYAATDVGVYYFDPDFVEAGHVGKWRCFNYQLPNSLVNGLRIDYCEGVMYASVLGRGLWKVPLMPEEDTELVVSNDEEWDYYKEVVTDIRVKNNATLTIRGDLIMLHKKRITVEPGSELKVLGGRITSACDDKPWYGIVAMGDNSQHQYPIYNPTYQSRVRLVDATIENAINAVTCIGKTSDFNHEWGTAGAVISANNTLFRNNKRSVEFMSYQNFDPATGDPRDNVSRFDKCRFVIDQDYLDNSPYDQNTQITAWKVRGVQILACEFIMPFNTSSPIEESKAIYCGDASLKIDHLCSSASVPCTSYLRSRFEGFDVAIDVDNSSSFYPMFINDAEFFNNYYAISLNGASYSRITKNSINNDKNYPDFTGIGLYNMTGFAVEENDIKTDKGSITAIRVKDLYSSVRLRDDVIYKNYLTDAEEGVEIQGFCGYGAYGGVIAECNKFGSNVSGGSDNLFDIRINVGAFTKEIWGSDRDPLENFFCPPASSERNIKLGELVNSNINTYMWNQIVIPAEPLDRTASINEISVPSSTLNCDSKIRDFDNGSITDIKKKRDDIKVPFQDLEANYQQIINGTMNSQTVIDLLAIDNSSRDVLIQELIDQTPNVSDASLIRAIGYSKISDLDLVKVLVWNSPLSSAVEQEVSRSNRFNTQYLDLILDHTNGNKRFFLDARMSALASEWGYLEGLYIQKLTSDTELSLFDVDFISGISHSTDIYDLSLAVDWYIDKRQYVNAKQLLNSGSFTNVSGSSHWVDFKNLQIDIEMAGRNWFDLQAGELTQLQTMASNQSKKAYQLAENILEWIEYSTFEEPKRGISTPVRKSSEFDIHIDGGEENEHLSVFPNPGSGTMNIDWKVNIEEGEVQLKLMNLLGQVVWKDTRNASDRITQIDGSKFASGSYIFVLEHETGVMKQKVEILH